MKNELFYNISLYYNSIYLSFLKNIDLIINILLINLIIFMGRIYFLSIFFISCTLSQGIFDFLKTKQNNPFNDEFLDAQKLELEMLGKKNDDYDDDFISNYQDADCLISIDDLKNKIDSSTLESLTEGSIKRLRFIYGKCNPVLFIPGLMATRLQLRVDCKEYVKDEQAFKEMNEHCKNNNICPADDESGIRRLVLWPSILSDFNLFKLPTEDGWQNSNSCMAFFMQHYNSKESCPNLKTKNGKTVNSCRYSPHVKIIPYGIETSLRRAEHCGFGSVNNIAYSKHLSLFLNLSNKSTKGFDGITDQLLDLGYSRGFSFAASPYDFKEAECENKHFESQFEKLVNMLYENTGKKVILIAHSYGNLNINHQLISNPGLKNKIKHIVNIAGPLSGTIKSEQLLNTGSSEFMVLKKLGFEAGVDKEYQSIIIPFSKSTYQTRVRSMNDIFPDAKYRELKEALKERIDYEECERKKEALDTNKQVVCKHEKKLYSILGDHFPFLQDENICQLPKDWKRTKADFENQSNNNPQETNPIFFPCHFNFFNHETCPYAKIVANKNESNDNNTKKDKLCNVSSPELDEKSFFICDEKEKNKNNGKCQNDLLFNYGNQIKNFPHIKEFLSSSIVYDHMKDAMKKLDFKCNESSSIPDIDVTVIFNKSFETKAGYLYTYDKSQDLLSFPDKKDVIYSGGDGSVNTEGALYPFIKALYDKKLGQFKSNIKFVDYCSAADSKHLYSTSDQINNPYTFLNCDCKQSDGKFKIDKSVKCNHSAITNDSFIISYIKDFVLTHNTSDEELKILDRKKEEFILKVNQAEGHFPEQCNLIFNDVYGVPNHFISEKSKK